MIVMKFGGSSVANAERIRHVASIIKAYQKNRPVVVLSAMGDTTDHLLEAADKALGGVVSMKQIASLHFETLEFRQGSATVMASALSPSMDRRMTE